MARRRARGELAIFSTSFLDLLFCALAAITLLWVLLDPPSQAQEPSRFQFMSFRQQGIRHFQSIQIDGDMLDATDNKSRRAKFIENHFGNGLMLSILDDAGAGFAHSLMIGANDNTKPCNIEITFRECNGKKHFIWLSSLSERGESNAVFSFSNSEDDNLAAAEKEMASKSFKGRKIVLDNIAVDSGDNGELLKIRLYASKGKIRIQSVTPSSANGIVGL